VSKHTIYARKAKYGGLEVNEAQRLKQLEDENGRLKKLVADLSSDKEMLRAVSKKTDRARSPEDGGALAAGAVPGQRAPGLRASVVGGQQLSIRIVSFG
jgi:hypothetical protein